MIALGVVALLATLADTVRLFLRSPDHSILAIGVWGAWTLALFAPIAWALRDRDGAPPAGEAARTYLILGYGTAILALRVVEISLAR